MFARLDRFLVLRSISAALNVVTVSKLSSWTNTDITLSSFALKINVSIATVPMQDSRYPHPEDMITRCITPRRMAGTMAEIKTLNIGIIEGTYVCKGAGGIVSLVLDVHGPLFQTLTRIGVTVLCAA